MAEENQFQKKRIIDEDPQIFPHLTKRVLNLDDFINSQQLKNKIGEYGISLNNMKKKSIYKKLLLDPQVKEAQKIANYNYQEMREIRNKYLKKLVESNPFYFPKELGLDEYKKPINTKEERLNKLLKHLEEQAKKERGNNINSRKNSSLTILNSRKESMLLENKRKRTESLVIEEVDNKKNKNKVKKEENEEEQNVEEENGEASYYEEEEDYGHPDDDDSQNYNYSYGEGNDED
jgi:hypothetical protein